MAFLKSLKKSASFPLFLCVEKKKEKLIVMYHNVSKQKQFHVHGMFNGQIRNKVTNTSNCAPSFIDKGRFSIGHQISSPKRKTSSWCKLYWWSIYGIFNSFLKRNINCALSTNNPAFIFCYQLINLLMKATMIAMVNYDLKLDNE